MERADHTEEFARYPKKALVRALAANIAHGHLRSTTLRLTRLIALDEFSAIVRAEQPIIDEVAEKADDPLHMWSPLECQRINKRIARYDNAIAQAKRLLADHPELLDDLQQHNSLSIHNVNQEGRPGE